MGKSAEQQAIFFPRPKPAGKVFLEKIIKKQKIIFKNTYTHIDWFVLSGEDFSILILPKKCN